MFIFVKSKTGAIGINLANVVDFTYDHKLRKLAFKYVDGRSYTTMDDNIIKAFFDAISELEKQNLAKGVSIG